MLEKMNEFFDKRLDGYDEHMMTCIDFADEFYPYTANLLPKDNNAKILDLGCGTGLELEHYFKLNQSALITGIDLTESMLNKLKNKFADKNMELILGSYFDVPFGENVFDAAVSVESLHHFTKEEKIPLYRKLYKALKDNGYFILTDYFALSDAEEKMYRNEYQSIKTEQGIGGNDFYHFDTPLTVKHETEALHEAGFACVEIIKNYGVTQILKAKKL